MIWTIADLGVLFAFRLATQKSRGYILWTREGSKEEEMVKGKGQG